MSDKVKKLMTLCVIHKGEQVLLGMKKRGFGAGRWNGFGGKLEAGETIEQAALREVREEVGLELLDLKELGVIEFDFESEPKILEVHIFKATSYKGEPIETEEMRPEWFNISEIPFKQMWSDDGLWFPYLLENKKFAAKFLFDKPATAEHEGKILKQEISAI